MNDNIKPKGAKGKAKGLILIAAVVLLLGLWAAPPAYAVTGLTAQTGESGKVALSWEFTGYAWEYRFDIYVYNSDGGFVQMRSTNLTGYPAPMSYQVSELTNGTQYTIMILEYHKDRITGTWRLMDQQTITATPYAAAHSFKAEAPAGIKAGESFAVTVTALKADGTATETGYTGQRHISRGWNAGAAPDGTAPVKPADGTVTFTGGVAVIPGFTLYNSGETPAITVTDADGKTGGGQITLLPADASELVLSTPAATAAGQPFDINVAMRDTYGNTATTYTGTVSFASSDPSAQLPANYTFTAGDNGVKTFTGAILKTAGSRTVSVADVQNGALAGVKSITVNPGALAGFTVELAFGESPIEVKMAAAGQLLNMKVTAMDGYGNVASGYTGTVAFESSDAFAQLPGNYTFAPGDSGVKAFTVVLGTPGSRTLTVREASGTIEKESVLTVLRVNKISAGYYFSLAVKPDGTVAAWGDNSYGKCSGAGGQTGVVAVAAGGGHALALKEDGTVVAWGDSSRGRCTVPAGLSNVVAIAARTTHSLALKSDGTVVAWGDSSRGQCTVPADLADVVAIAAGSAHSLALKSDGTVAAWGYDYYGQCSGPAEVSGAAAIAAGGNTTMVVDAEEGSVLKFGNDPAHYLTVPAGLQNVTAIAICMWDNNAAAITSDGNVTVWGNTDYSIKNVPPGLNREAAGIAFGTQHILALKSDGTVLAWGRNDYGQTNVPSGLNLAAGRLGGLAISEGSLTPAFAPDTTSYTASVSRKVGSLNVTASVENPGYVLTINGAPAQNEVPVPVGLDYGENIITVRVAGSGGLTRTYTLTVTREIPVWSAQASAAQAQPVAGGDNTVTFTVRDNDGEIDAGFTGQKTVTVSGYLAAPGGSSGSFNGAALTGGSTATSLNFTEGVASANLILHKAAAQALIFIIEDVGPQVSLNITPAPATAASMALTQNIAAPAANGGQFAVQPVIQLKDSFGNICTNDNSTAVTVSKADTGAWMLAGTLSATASGGTATFTGLAAHNTAAVTGAKLRFTVPGLTPVESAAVNLPASTATQKLVVLLPPGIQTGVPFEATVEARNISDGIDTGFTGEVSFFSSDLAAALPGNYTFQSGDNGRKTFTVAFNTAGHQTLTVSAVSDASLLGYWRFDEGTGSVLKDSSQGGRTGAVIRGTVWVEGAPETYFTNPSGLQFNGSNGYAQINPAPDLANKSFSIGFWAKRDRTVWTYNEWIIGQGTGSEDKGLHIGFRKNDNQFSFAFYSDDLNIPASDYINDTQWHHWLVTYDAATKTQSAYQDGILRGTRIANNHFNNTGVMYVGVRFDTGYFGGSVDDLQIYNRVLSIEEIGKLSTGGATLVYGQAAQTYTVTLPTGTGFTAAPETGSASPVDYNGSYSFRITLDPAYSNSVITVKSNETVLTPDNGVYTITGITENQIVTVEGVQMNVALQSIAVTTPPSKTTYYIGEALDLTGLVVTGTYSDDSTAVLSITAANVSGFNSSVLKDDQIITITYEGKTATFTVDIEAEPGTFAGGRGYSDNPFQIATPEHLNNIRSFLGAYYIQTADIDLTGVDWEPAGTYAAPFTGNYDGKGYKITNLNIDRPDGECVGLFGNINGGTVEKLHITGAVVKGKKYVGILTGQVLNSGKVIGCSVDGSVTSTTSGEVFVGGLAGYVTSGGEITKSHSKGTVSASSGNSVGGLVGRNEGTIKECFSSGAVTGHTWVGGLVGSNWPGLVENSYATGSVNGSLHVGGLVGSHGTTTTPSVIRNSYSIGRVTGTNSVGGLVADLYGGTIENGYYDKDTSGQSNTGKGTPLATSDMMKQVSFSGWNFTTTWRNINEYTYPVLRWQPLSADERIITDWLDLDWEDIKGSNSTENSVTTDLNLISIGANGTTITWSVPAGSETWLDPETGAVTRPTDENKAVTLTAVVSYTGGTPRTTNFDLTVIKASSITIASITPVGNVSVAYGTGEAAAIAALTSTTTITDSDGATHTVNLNWTIDGYNATTPGNYTATGTFTLPEGVSQTDPVTPLEVTATVTVQAQHVPSSNANLSSLTLSIGTLVPGFDPDVINYTVNVGNSVSSVDVTPVLADSEATMTVNDAPVASGSAKPITLIVGNNTVSIIVTAESGATKTYTVNINRAAPSAETYPVTYHANGGSGTAPTESNKAAGDTFTAAAANSFTAPAGQRFKEWNTSSDGGGDRYEAGATVTMPASALTLYAIWETAVTANSGLKVTIVESGRVTLNDTQINSNYDYRHPMDMDVRLEATPNAGYTFAYWANVGASNDSIISTNPVYQRILGAGINVKAVFSKIPSVEDTQFTVVFKDKSGRILQSSFVDKDTAATPPTDPVIVGYRFKEWSPAYTNVTSDLIVAAIYERLPATYTVTVEGGTLSTGGAQGTYQFDMPVTVMAGTAPAGKQFSHWTLDNVKVSTKNTFSFFAPMRDTELKAVFVDDDLQLNNVPFITLSEHVMVDTDNKTMMFTAIKNVPAGYTLVECGAILTNSLTGELTLDTPDVIRLKLNNLSNDQFYVRRTHIAPLDTWYVRAYMIYKDSNGNMVTVYSENTVNQTMGG